MRQAIEESVGPCDVLIAVIGRHWLISSDEEGKRRIDNPEDFLRIEISTALKRDIRVIPVLLECASMPPSDDLPDELKSLVHRQALEVSHNRFMADSKRLIGAVEQALGAVRAKQQCKREKEERLDAERREERAPRVLEKATKEQPWHNSLGMKFVPVAARCNLEGAWV